MPSPPSSSATARGNGANASVQPPNTAACCCTGRPEPRRTPTIHPDCEEVFVVHEGCAEFTFDDEPPVEAGPGSVLYAPRGSPHALRVVGDEPLLMMCFLAPNLPDDEVPA